LGIGDFFWNYCLDSFGLGQILFAAFPVRIDHDGLFYRYDHKKVMDSLEACNFTFIIK
jgi:hypothetical protein